MNRDTLGRTILFVIMGLMALETFVLGATYTASTATGILKEVTTEQVSGELGFVIIVVGLVLAGITLVTTKNFIYPALVMIGTIIVAMSPDLANGIAAQFS